jgi:hypothetical protein
VIRSSQDRAIISIILPRVGKGDSLSSTAESTFKFVKDAVVLVQITKLLTKVVVNVDRLDWLVLHGDIPDLESEIISR